VLLIGRGSATSDRLRQQLVRRGLRVDVVADCGVATEALAGGDHSAVILDVASAGFGAAAFREMLAEDHPGLALLEVPGGEGTGEDVVALARALEREIARRPEAAPAPEEPVDSLPAPQAFEDLTSRNPQMIELFRLIPRVAQTDSPVLILGETGTGKELVAAAIHRHSRRHQGEFFTVNCGALTDSLLESELFGHEKGAFTGAIREKSGYFELASGGTLFLDELGTISQAMQVRLLRVLERMEVRRVGGDELRRVDVRIVAATNASLEEAVAEGTFREDLYYRLNVVQLQIPPLRERPEDIPLLAEVFWRKFAAEQHREGIVGVEAHAERLLVGYPWPGNVRELENVMERAVILAQGQRLKESDLPERLRRAEVRRSALPSFDVEESLAAVLERLNGAVEKEYLRRVLRRYRGSVARASEHAGLNRRTLYNKMRAHGLRREEFLDGGGLRGDEA
jgi:DNA-binding NtrC family response regulator